MEEALEESIHFESLQTPPPSSHLLSPSYVPWREDQEGEEFPYIKSNQSASLLRIDTFHSFKLRWPAASTFCSCCHLRWSIPCLGINFLSQVTNEPKNTGPASFPDSQGCHRGQSWSCMSCRQSLGTIWNSSGLGVWTVTFSLEVSPKWSSERHLQLIEIGLPLRLCVLTGPFWFNGPRFSSNYFQWSPLNKALKFFSRVREIASLAKCFLFYI